MFPLMILDEFNQLKVNYDELLRQDRNEQDLGPVFDDGSSPDVEVSLFLF